MVGRFGGGLNENEVLVTLPFLQMKLAMSTVARNLPTRKIKTSWRRSHRLLLLAAALRYKGEALTH